MAKQGRDIATSVAVALIYTRVSSDDQEREGVSLDAQLAEARRYAGDRGWAIGGEFQDVMTGKRDDRPAYQALLAEVRSLRAAGQSVVVVVAALDRFGRRVLERVRAREELKALGVPTHSIREGGEVSDLVANILASVAEEETRRLGERVSAAKQFIMAQGWFPGRRPGWGYLIRDATPDELARGSRARVLDARPDQAPYVREMFERLARGESLNAVSRWLGGLPATVRGDRRFTVRDVFKLRSSPLYIARPADGDADPLKRPRCQWPALVDDATWRRVQEQFEIAGRVPKQASGNYLLTGFLWCSQCGMRMHGDGSGGASPLPRYRCSALQSGALAPDLNCRYIISCHHIDPTVRAEVSVLVSALTAADAELLVELRRAWEARRQEDDDGGARARRLHALEQIVSKAKQRLARAASLYADGELDKEGYSALRDTAIKEVSDASGEIERLRAVTRRPALPDLDTVLAEVGGWTAAWEEANVAAQRAVLAVLIQRVTAVRLKRGRYAITIQWTERGEALHAAAAAIGYSRAA